MTTDVETREKKLNIIGIITLTVVYAITVVFNSLAGALGGSKEETKSTIVLFSN